jgi:hypothetical protein
MTKIKKNKINKHSIHSIKHKEFALLITISQSTGKDPSAETSKHNRKG